MFVGTMFLNVRGFRAGSAFAPPPLGASTGGTAATAAAVQDAAAVEAALGLARPTRRLIQQGLRNEGFDPGAPDGLLGPRTRAPDFADTEYLDSAQADALRAAGSLPVAGVGDTGTERTVGASVLATPAAEASGVEPLSVAGALPSAFETIETPAPAIVEAPAVSAEVVTAVQAARNFRLPLEVLVDRHLQRVDRLLAAGEHHEADEHHEASEVLNQIAVLQREHGLRPLHRTCRRPADGRHDWRVCPFERREKRRRRASSYASEASLGTGSLALCGRRRTRDATTLGAVSGGCLACTATPNAPELALPHRSVRGTLGPKAPRDELVSARKPPFRAEIGANAWHSGRDVGAIPAATEAPDGLRTENGGKSARMSCFQGQ